MIISSPSSKKLVSEYDFLLSNGLILPITLKPEDTIDFGPEKVTIFISPRPSLTDPKILSPAEDIKIFNSHILSISHRDREVEETTPANWEEIFKEIGTTIQ